MLGFVGRLDLKKKIADEGWQLYEDQLGRHICLPQGIFSSLDEVDNHHQSIHKANH